MEKAVKQRLLGGVVLVAGAVLLLPLLLDGSGASLTVPPMPAPPEVAGVEAIAPDLEQRVQAADQAVSEAHAGRDAAPAEPAPAGPAQDVVADPAAQAAATPGVPPAELATQPVPAPERAPPAPAKPAASKPAPQAASTSVAKPAAAPTALPEAWVVQVASLSSQEKAQELVRKLRAKSYPAVLHRQGGLWKVVVGPELSREVADTLKARLAADPELRLNGWVQAYKP